MRCGVHEVVAIRDSPHVQGHTNKAHAGVWIHKRNHSHAWLVCVSLHQPPVWRMRSMNTNLPSSTTRWRRTDCIDFIDQLCTVQSMHRGCCCQLRLRDLLSRPCNISWHAVTVQQTMCRGATKAKSSHKSNLMFFCSSGVLYSKVAHPLGAPLCWLVGSLSVFAYAILGLLLGIPGSIFTKTSGSSSPRPMPGTRMPFLVLDSHICTRKGEQGQWQQCRSTVTPAATQFIQYADSSGITVPGTTM